MASRKRLRDNWGPVRGRAAETASAVASDPDPSKRPPGRKDTRSWCRGKAGVPHQPVIVFRPTWTRRPQPACEWAADWIGEQVRWHCHHEEHCGPCGKILRTRIADEECPDYPGDPAQRAEAEREAAAYPEQWRAWAQRHGRPKPVIDGPQKYRRKRSA